MPMVCGIKFRGAGKVYTFATGGVEDLREGDRVIVETTRGQELAVVVRAPAEVAEAEVVGELKPVVRKATDMDLAEADKYRQREAEAATICAEHVHRLGLPMKVVGTEYNFDGSRLTVFFTSEDRVDFRQLVRDLARALKTHIDLRQIGVRDEARIVGGVGRCGRPLCCATWLADFSPVSIRMAKAQDLPLSPMEISGLCGRLLCCLAYEQDYYHDVKARFPKVGKAVVSPLGPAKVIRVSVLHEKATLLLEDGSTVDVSAEQLAGEAPIDLKDVENGRRPPIADRVDEAMAATLSRNRGNGALPTEAPRARRRLADVVPAPDDDGDWGEREEEEDRAVRPMRREAVRPPAPERAPKVERAGPPATRASERRAPQQRADKPRRDQGREAEPRARNVARQPSGGEANAPGTMPGSPARRARRSRGRRSGGANRGSLAAPRGQQEPDEE